MWYFKITSLACLIQNHATINIKKIHDGWCRNPALTWMTFNRQDDSKHHADCIVETMKRAVLSERRVCLTASSKRVLQVPLYVCVSISYSSHKPCGATAQRVRFDILEKYFLGLISFVPQGLSGMGWLHAQKVHAQHARDQNRFSSIPVMKKRNLEKKEKSMETFTFSLQVCRRRCKHLWVLTACAYVRACSHTCVCVCVLQISALVRLLFLIWFCASVCVGSCVQCV